MDLTEPKVLDALYERTWGYDCRFELFCDLGQAIVPSDYVNNSSLRRFARKIALEEQEASKNNQPFAGAFKNLRRFDDKRFESVSNKLWPGNRINVRLFTVKRRTSFEVVMAYIAAEGGTHFGLQGAVFAYDTLMRRIPLRFLSCFHHELYCHSFDAWDKLRVQDHVAHVPFLAIRFNEPSSLGESPADEGLEAGDLFFVFNRLPKAGYIEDKK